MLSIPWIWHFSMCKSKSNSPSEHAWSLISKDCTSAGCTCAGSTCPSNAWIFQAHWAGDEELWKLQGSTKFIETVAGPMAFFMSAAKLLCDVLHEMYNFSLKNSQGHWKLLLKFLITSLPFRCIRRWSLRQIVKVLARCILAAASLILMVDSRNLPMTFDFWSFSLDFISIFNIFFHF